jgi:hypothetical protein
MSDGDLTARIGELMPRARLDLAELVAFRSVADPSELTEREDGRWYDRGTGVFGRAALDALGPPGSAFACRRGLPARKR